MLSALDNSIFYLINKNLSNKLFDIFMPYFTELGNLNLLLFVGIILLLIRKKEIRILGILLILGLFASNFIVDVLKIWIARPRPSQILPNINLLVRASGFGFPSSHATSAFMAATLISGCTKKLYFLFLVAIAVAISRIYIGVHFPFDCLAGALLGIMIGFVITMVYELILNKI